MKTIGLTTTVPIEVLIAAGYKAIDLNNIFVTADDYIDLIDIAERDGFPKSMCAWIKGIYGACIKNDIKEIVGVIEGDCSNTHALIEVLESKNIKVYPFAFPFSHKEDELKVSIDNFMDIFNVKTEEVENIRQRVNLLRKKVIEIDKMTYTEHKVTGFENHILQLCMSDFDGNLDNYEELINNKIDEINKRVNDEKKIKLAYIGVPPMMGDLHDYIETLDARFTYNEVQREFAFPRALEAKNIYEQYNDYTYPYDLDFRIREIKKQIKERKIEGIIHYTQAFCYKAIQDIVIKKELNIPILTIEGDKSTELDARTNLRLEAFIDMIKDLKED